MNFNIEEIKNIDIKTLFSKDNKNLPYVLGGVAVVIILYYIIFIGPILGKLFKSIPEISKLKTELQLTKSDIEKKELFKKELAALKEKFVLYETKLPGEKEIPSVLGNLSKIAKVSGIDINKIELLLRSDSGKTAAKDSVYTEIPIEISAKCGYHDLGIFINKLENSERFMKVDDIVIEGNPSSPRVHNVKLIVNTYVLPKEDVANNAKK